MNQRRDAFRGRGAVGGLLSAFVLLAGCSASTDETGEGFATPGGSGGSGSTGATGGGATGGVGATGGTGATAGTGATGGTGNNTCAKSAAAADASVDVIVVIDGSGSMSDDIERVRDNVNGAFVNILAGSNLSWRLVVVAPREGMGGMSSNSLCVPQPPAGPSCSDGPRFTHVHCAVESTDAFASLGFTYAGVLPPFLPGFGAMVCGGLPGNPILAPSWDGKQWKNSIRFQATKVILAITDDESDVEASAFDNWLTTQAEPAGMFGTTQDRRYLFYGILGHETGNPNAVCNTAEGPAPAVGKKYQRLAQMTGGTTLSICEEDWSAMFNDIASRIIGQLGCVYPAPNPPNGEELDPDKVNVRYTPGGGSEELIGQDNNKPCDQGANGWQWSSDKKKILLCGDTCQRVKSDPEGKMSVEFGCKTVVVPPPS